MLKIFVLSYKKVLKKLSVKSTPVLSELNQYLWSYCHTSMANSSKLSVHWKLENIWPRRSLEDFIVAERFHGQKCLSKIVNIRKQYSSNTVYKFRRFYLRCNLCVIISRLYKSKWNLLLEKYYRRTFSLSLHADVNYYLFVVGSSYIVLSHFLFFLHPWRSRGSPISLAFDRPQSPLTAAETPCRICSNIFALFRGCVIIGFLVYTFLFTN